MIVSVAPIALATSSLEATVSIAMMRDAPAIAAPVDRGQPDAAAADHRDGGARLHHGGMGHRAHAGHHAAADQRAAIQRHVVTHPQHRMLVHQHLLGEGGEVHSLVQRLAFPGEAACHARLQLDLGVLAEGAASPASGG
jgi:hypothetical protein